MRITYTIPSPINPREPYARWASWFGCGYLSPAPGTWGSMVALPLGLILYALGGPILLLLGICALIPVGLWAAQEFGKKIGEHDSKHIVIDEVAGMWIALVPAALNPLLIVVAFIAFRGFDILKPWPVCFFDKKMHNAAGVMLDDIVAGLMACMVVISVEALV